MVSFGALMGVIILLWVIALVISLLFNLFARLQKRLASRVKQFKPEATPVETEQVSALRRRTLAGLNLTLAICIGLLAFTANINKTILNPDFVVNHLSDLSVRAMVKELLNTQLPEGQRYAAETLEATVQ